MCIRNLHALGMSLEANFSSPQPVLLVLGELHNPISDHEMNKSSPALRRARRRPPLSLPLWGDHICHVYPSTTLSSGGKRGGDRCLGVWTRGVSVSVVSRSRSCLGVWRVSDSVRWAVCAGARCVLVAQGTRGTAFVWG